MLRLPSRFATVILTFAPLFFQRSWRHTEVLLTGAILTPGTRIVASILRISGLAGEQRFVNYHRVLNRAAWCPRTASRLLLGLLLTAFVPSGPVVLGIDDTIERRRGKRITAKGIYRDPVRSSHGHFVKTSGLRWLSLMLLAPVPWAGRIWVLPFLTALASSERYCQQRGRPHKKLTDWGRQLVLQTRRWLPGRKLVVVGDSGFAALGFLAALRRYGVTCITRLRLDAALYDPAPPRLPGTNGRSRTKGKRLANLSKALNDPTTLWERVMVLGWYGGGERLVEISTANAVWRNSGMPIVPIRWLLVRDPLGRLDPQALLCTDPTRDPAQVLRWFVQRRQVKSRFAKCGTTSASKRSANGQIRPLHAPRLAYSACFLSSPLGKQLTPHARHAVATSAWYRKQHPTFSDTLAAVRRHIWREQGFATSIRTSDARKLQLTLRNAITYALCSAA